jgi:hypothetical protein
MKNFIDSVRAGKYTKDVLHIRHGHAAACLSHMANVSYRLGKKLSTGEVKERLSASKAAQDTLADFFANLEANQIDLSKDLPAAGPWLEFDPASEKFVGEFADEANKIAMDDYASGFELPTIS